VLSTEAANKYQFEHLWFYLTGADTHNLPHSRRAH